MLLLLMIFIRCERWEVTGVADDCIEFLDRLDFPVRRDTKLPVAVEWPSSTLLLFLGDLSGVMRRRLSPNDFDLLRGVRREGEYYVPTMQWADDEEDIQLAPKSSNL